MAIHNADIARAFDEIADLLELGDENPFRIRAYRNAARVVGELRYGVGQARRGWLSTSDVLNTRPLGELKRLLR